MCFLCWKFFMLQNLLFRKVFYAINPFTLKTQNLLFSNVFYAIRPLKQCNLPYTKDRHAARVPGLVFPASSAGVSFGVKKGRLFERSEFLPFSRRKHRSSRKNAALILSFWFFFFRIKTKEKEYSVTLPKIGKAWKIIRNCSLLGSSLKIQAPIYFLPEKPEPEKRHFLDD